MDKLNSENLPIYKIDTLYTKRQLIIYSLVAILVNLILIGVAFIVIFAIKENVPNFEVSIVWNWYIWIVLIIDITTIGISRLFAGIYQKNFEYQISEKFITIQYGILSRTKTTIPFSRIQNIAIHQNLIDRILKIYTVKVETAGSGGGISTSGGPILVKPEGYIPAIIDPTHLENIINTLVHKYTQEISPQMKSKVFIDNNVAFDEFIAYFLSKMREKDQLHTNITNLREKANISKLELAEKINVSETTINYLEAGEYVPSLTLALKIARFFNISVENIFKLNN